MTNERLNVFVCESSRVWCDMLWKCKQS